MDIKRTGARKFHGWTSIVDETPISSIQVNKDRNIELRLTSLRIPNLDGKYNLVVTLTPNDIGKIMAEVYKQALTKNT